MKHLGLAGSGDDRAFTMQHRALGPSAGHRRICSRLSPLLLVEMSSVDRLQALPSHVKRVVAEAAFHGSSIALGRMVSHFDEVDVVVIVEGFATSRHGDEMDVIKD